MQVGSADVTPAAEAHEGKSTKAVLKEVDQFMETSQPKCIKANSELRSFWARCLGSDVVLMDSMEGKRRARTARILQGTVAPEVQRPRCRGERRSQQEGSCQGFADEVPPGSRNRTSVGLHEQTCFVQRLSALQHDVGCFCSLFAVCSCSSKH